MEYKVLHIVNRNNLGGLLLIALNIAKYLPKPFRISIVSGVKDKHEGDTQHWCEAYNIQPTLIYEMRRSINPIKDIIAYRKLKKIIKDYQPHIVHTHAAKAGFLGRLAAYQCKVPVIIHQFHGHVFKHFFASWFSKVIVSIEKYISKKCHAIITISNELKEELCTQYKVCESDRTYVLPIGISFDKFETNIESNRNAFRHSQHVLSNELAVGIVGRVVGSKNVTLFLDILSSCVQQSNKKIKGFVIGDGDDIVLVKQHALSLQKEKNLPEDWVTFTSWYNKVEEVFAGLDVVMLTSLNDGTPVSLLEAQASKKPVIATKVGGVPYTLIHNKTGFLHEVNDVNGMVNSLLMLCHNDDVRQEMGVNGNQFVKQNFSIENMVMKLSDLYINLLQKHMSNG